MAEAHHTCKSCSNQFTGSFCNVCGEKVLTPADKSFKTILNSVMLTITFADSKFIRTLWQVLRKPGTVARDFAAGKRVTEHQSDVVVLRIEPDLLFLSAHSAF
jgi:hypothetical protein